MVLDPTNIIPAYTASILFFVGFLILLGTLFIFGINEALSRLAIYHSPKTRYNCHGEPFYIKVWRVFTLYVFLSIFFFVAILVTMRFSGITNLAGAVISSEIGTIFLLIIIRLLLNPISDIYLKGIYPKESREGAIKIFKERIVSLFFSYLCITWMVFILYLLVNIGVSIQISLDYFVPSDLFDLSSISLLFFSYVISLLILTLITEGFLRWCLPIDQIPWNDKKD
jgi:hypothetical protein